MLKLPTKVRYAVRAVVELAERGDSSPVPVKILAEAQDISSKYGKQLMNRLRRAGIVEGFPGAHGGYKLARKPSKITLLEIYEALEEAPDLVPCVRPRSGCKRLNRCSARFIWKELNDLLENKLRSITVDQLTSREDCVSGRERNHDLS